MTTFTETSQYTVTGCCICGVQWGVPTELYQYWKRDGTSFYCPNGHRQSMTDTTKQQLERAQKQLAQKEMEVIAAKASLERQRKEAQRLRKRAANGVCPCCHRQFVNVARHMHTKHPDYAEQGSSNP